MCVVEIKVQEVTNVGGFHGSHLCLEPRQDVQRHTSFDEITTIHLLVLILEESSKDCQLVAKARKTATKREQTGMGALKPETIKARGMNVAEIRTIVKVLGSR